MRVEIDDDDVDRVVIASLKRTLSTLRGLKKDKLSEADHPSLIAACKTLIEYYGG